MSPSSDRQILSRSRSVAASRAGLTTTRTAGYTVYVAVLIIAIVAVPLLRAVVLGLATPEVIAAMTSPHSYRAVGAIAAMLAACALTTARTRGPVVPSPFLAEFLAGSGLARGDTMRRHFLVTVTVMVVAAVTISGLAVVALLLDASTAAVPAAIIVLGFASYACALAMLSLIGQSSPRRVTTPLALVILGSAYAVAVGVDIVTFATPWGWLALLWESLGPNKPIQWLPVVALALSPLAFLAAPALLNNLRLSELMTQSRRWQTIGTLVQTGDVAGATGTLRTPPTRGRHGLISLNGPLPIAIVQRDLGTARRFPLRTALGSLAIVCAGWLSAQTATASEGINWVAALSGPLLAYLAVGVLCDGLRNANENAGPSSLYGGSAVTMIGSHTILPFIACIIFGSTGTVAATFLGAPITTLPWWTLLSVFVVLVRVLDCAKGPMPIGLLLPVVTPVGDVAILNVIAWQADALLIVLTTAGALTVFHSTAALDAAVWLTACIGVVAALAGRRIRALAVTS